ncbi:MAG: hypothetical protein U0703_10215 [Anaerolineae bacterium]
MAVIRGPSPELTLKLVDALVRGGVLGIEITFTTPDAVGVTRSLHQQFGDSILLGMGTLTEPQHAQQAVDAGATFLVSPHTEAELGRAMTATGLVTMMGALTPTEVMAAKKLGTDVVKLFPGVADGSGIREGAEGTLPRHPGYADGRRVGGERGEWFAAGYTRWERAASCARQSGEGRAVRGDRGGRRSSPPPSSRRAPDYAEPDSACEGRHGDLLTVNPNHEAPVRLPAHLLNARRCAASGSPPA